MSKAYTLATLATSDLAHQQNGQYMTLMEIAA
jgi:hypothetical protein